MDNPINELDNLIRQQMEGYQVPPPQGVFEAVSKAVNAPAAGTASSGLLGKSLGKIILGIASAGIVSSGVWFYAQTTQSVDKISSPATAVATASPNPTSNTHENLPATSVQPETTKANKGSDNPRQLIASGLPEYTEPRGSAANGSQLPEGSKPEPDLAKPASAAPATPVPPELSIDGPDELCPGQEAEYRVSCNRRNAEVLVSFSSETEKTALKNMRINHRFTAAGKNTVRVEAVVDGKIIEATKEVQVKPLQVQVEVDYQNYPDLRLVATPGADRYQWTLGEGHTEQTVTNEWIHHLTLPEGDSQVLNLTLTAMNNTGCQATCRHSVTLYGLNEPVIPNAFSPNTDGLNDHFEILCKNTTSYHLEIFDRSGLRVFESFAPTNTWNGKVNGELVNGTYYYRFTFSHSSPGSKLQTRSGTIAVLSNNR